MNRNDLKKILEKEGFKAAAYSLTGGQPSEALCLSFEGLVWYVYYSEHGMRTDEVQFDTEEDACTYFFEKLRADPTTRSRRNGGE